jgi:hypothetical protein
LGFQLFDFRELSCLSWFRFSFVGLPKTSHERIHSLFIHRTARRSVPDEQNYQNYETQTIKLLLAAGRDLAGKVPQNAVSQWVERFELTPPDGDFASHHHHPKAPNAAVMVTACEQTPRG